MSDEKREIRWEDIKDGKVAVKCHNCIELNLNLCEPDKCPVWQSLPIVEPKKIVPIKFMEIVENKGGKK